MVPVFSRLPSKPCSETIVRMVLVAVVALPRSVALGDWLGRLGGFAVAWGGRYLHVVPAAAVMDLAFEQTGDLGEPRRLPRSTNDLNASNFHNRRPLGDAFPPHNGYGRNQIAEVAFQSSVAG